MGKPLTREEAMKNPVLAKAIADQDGRVERGIIFPTMVYEGAKARGWNNKRVSKAKNKLEQQWEAELERKKNAGEIAWYGYEVFTFKLADDTRYTPDFVVMLPDGRLQGQECKGSFWPQKNKAKFKVAREQLWFLDFVVVRRDALKRGGQWRVTPI